MSAGGKGYSYALVDLGTLNSNVATNQRAKLIPIIPPKLGHGNDQKCTSRIRNHTKK